MFFTIYKTTNLINGKYYIGKHQTKDLNDGYMGSGKRLKYAIAKYGIENFHKEVLHVCNTEKQMNTLEKILVVPDAELNYNLCVGGNGGFGYINSLITKEERSRRGINGNKKRIYQCGRIFSEETKQKISLIAQTKKGEKNSFYGKNHTDDTKKKIAKGASKRLGKKNGSFGTCWITKHNTNKKIMKKELKSYVELGWNRGRK